MRHLLFNFTLSPRRKIRDNLKVDLTFKKNIKRKYVYLVTINGTHHHSLTKSGTMDRDRCVFKGNTNQPFIGGSKCSNALQDHKCLLRSNWPSVKLPSERQDTGTVMEHLFKYLSFCFKYSVM